MFFFFLAEKDFTAKETFPINWLILQVFSSLRKINTDNFKFVTKGRVNSNLLGNLIYIFKLTVL